MNTKHQETIIDNEDEDVDNLVGTEADEEEKEDIQEDEMDTKE